MISIVCPILNEEKYISKCIESILAQDYPHDDMELLLVDGNSNDRTRNVIEEYIKHYSFIRLLDNPNKIVPYAMNIGINNAKGNIIIRLDAHATYEVNYFSTLVSSLNRLKADNVGSVCKTDVLNINSKTLAIREVLCNKFGVGNSTFRTGIYKEMEVDTVPFGCWKREVFEKYGLFDVRLVRNQDIELNKRIIHGGGKIFIVPNTYCTYLARETFNSIAKNNYGNGKWNILTVFYTKQLKSLSIRHFVPLIFIMSLILPSILAFIYLPFILVSLLSLIAYVSLLGFISFKLTIKKKLNFFYLLTGFIVLHLSYGWGSIMGLLKLPFVKE
jgi:glycosyltransferase involved in cell wall biosynthesis